MWKVKSRPPKPANRLAPDTIVLIQRLAREHPLWGAERIRGELLKLGVKVAKRTIQKYLRVVHVNVTAHPSDAWVAQHLREATPFGETAKHLICDNDTKYGPVFHAAAKTCGLDVIHTPYEAPRANAICDRFISSLRRECLDHVLVLGSRQLVRVPAEYSEYFNQSRPHQGLAQQTPASRRSGLQTAATGKSVVFPASSAAPVQRIADKLIAVPVLNGLHHSYAWTT